MKPATFRFLSELTLASICCSNGCLCGICRAIRLFLYDCQNNLMVYGASIGVVGISYLLYAKISVLSPISLLHFWNPIQFLQGKEILGTYTNVNCFGYPISLKISACVVIGLWLFLFIGSSFIVFTHAGNLQYRSFPSDINCIFGFVSIKNFGTLAIGF